MKKFTQALCFAIILSLSCSPLAYAQWTVIDPSNLQVNSVTAANTTVDANTNVVTTVQTYLATFNETVLKPLATITTLAAIFQNNKNITQLILGPNALLVRDPELYLKNTALATVQGGVDELAKQNSIFGNSVLSLVIGNTRANSSSLSIRLASINQSTLPRIQQVKMCNDDAALSALVQSSTALSGAEYTARKQALFDSLCRGNPDTDPALARRLMTLSNQNPSLDAFYAITQGDNAYTKALLSQDAIRQDAEAKKAQAQADLASGGGIKSKTTCTKTASNGGCIEQTIDQAASTLNSAFNDAQTSVTKTARSLLGTGSLLGTALTTVGLLATITSSFKSLNGGDSSSGGGSSSTVATIGQTNTAVTSTAGFTQDLQNDAQTKAVVSGAPIDQLNYHKDALVKLTTIDTDYLNTVGAYNAQLAVVKACFTQLKVEYPDETATSTAYDTRVSAAITFASTTKASNDILGATLNAELTKIATTTVFVNNTITKIQNSNSTEEISRTFQAYQDKVKADKLPDMLVGISRDGERVLFNSKYQQDIAQTGRIYNFKEDCTKIRQEIDKARMLQGAGA